MLLAPLECPQGPPDPLALLLCSPRAARIPRQSPPSSACGKRKLVGIRRFSCLGFLPPAVVDRLQLFQLKLCLDTLPTSRVSLSAIGFGNDRFASFGRNRKNEEAQLSRAARFRGILCDAAASCSAASSASCEGSAAELRLCSRMRASAPEEGEGGLIMKNAERMKSKDECGLALPPIRVPCSLSRHSTTWRHR